MADKQQEVEDFVKHYIENDGFIKDKKYKRGHQIKARWLALTWGLDEYKRLLQKL